MQGYNCGHIASQLGKSLGQETEIRAGRPKIPIVCNDIDEDTTKEEIHEVLEKEFGLIGLQKPALKT